MMPTNIIDKELEKYDHESNCDSLSSDLSPCYCGYEKVKSSLTTVREETIKEILKMSYRPHDSGYEFILTENVKKLLQSKLSKE